ncbi:MAG: hypothetical protein J6M59_11395 [Bacteroidaceae bacterium]|nr:hypothetical protein [Bacteroidaceae bacterium]SDG37496.1 hypothetical protein SAMN05216518_12833 [Bacteroidales bacterium KHT7]
MEKELKVAIVQTTLDNKVAWRTKKQQPIKMDYAEAARVWNEIIHTLDNYVNIEEFRKPDIILFPELSVAERFESEIKNLAYQTGCIIITGLDFKTQGNKVENKALVAIPYGWPHGYGRSRAKTFYFGKRFPSSVEKKFIEECGKEFIPCNQFYILDAREYGRIGLAICADFYDIERFALYKGRIQHLFILAYNKDVKSFNYLCEAISRLVYCNVVICNTGHYGGSICFSLKDKEWKRYIYRHEGANLFTSQVVRLPVRDFVDAQKTDNMAHEKGFKNRPPGYKWQYNDSDNKKE